MLSNMSNEEIIESQKEIQKTMSPKLIQVLQKRALEKKNIKKENVKIESAQSDKPTQEVNEKVKWMQPIVEKTKDSKSIRYDFDGKKLTTQNIDITSGLYHHGDEPDRPGYTIEELFHLVHSTVSSQRVVALSMFERILTHHQVHFPGEYLDIFEKMMQSDLGVLLFLCIDDKSVTIINAALKTLLAFITCDANEDWFDFLELNTFQGFQTVPLHVAEIKEKTLQEVLKVDVISALAKFGILDRFSFLMNENMISHHLIAKLLIPFARHSRAVCQQIIDCHKLLDGLLNHLDDPVVVKLWKLMCLSGRGLTLDLLKKFSIDFKFKMKLSQIAHAKDFSDKDLKLATEMLKFFSICVSYGVCIDICVEYFEILSVYAQLPFKKVSNSMDVSKAFFCLLETFLTHNSKEFDMTHYRSFVESECLVLLEQSYSQNLPSSFSCRILHFCATFFEYLPSNSVHLNGSVESLVKVEKYINKLANVMESIPQPNFENIVLPQDATCPSQIILFSPLSKEIQYTLSHVDYQSAITRIHFSLFTLVNKHPSLSSLANLIRPEPLFHAIQIKMKTITKYLYRSLLWFGIYFVKTFSNLDIALWTTWLLLPGDESLFQVLNEYIYSLVSFPTSKLSDFIMNYYNVPEANKEKDDLYLLKATDLTIEFDWYFAPIEGYFLDRTLTIDTTLLEQELEFILDLEKKKIAAYLRIPQLVRFSYLCKVFELEGEVFLESKIETLLKELLEYYSDLNLTPEKDYYYFFEALMAHYIATSFGQPTFTNYLQIFWKCKFPAVYRLHMIKEMKKLIENFDPEGQDYYMEVETNEELLNLYVDCLQVMDLKSNMIKFMRYHLEKNGLLFKLD